MKTTDKQGRKGLRSVLLYTLLIAVVIGLNLASGLLPTRLANLDLSAQKLYSLSTETKEALQTLDELDKSITIYFVCTAGKEDHRTAVLLNRYAETAACIDVEKVDPAAHADLLLQYTGDRELADNSLIILCGERRQVISTEMYDADGIFALEDTLNDAIADVVREEEKIAYTLTGHGALALDDSTKAAMALDGFRCEDLDLRKAEAVPENASLVIINGIRADMTAKEASCLLQYLKQGGRLLLTVEYSTESMTNLNRVTTYFSAEPGPEQIRETDPARYAQDDPAYLLPNIQTEEKALTAGIHYILLPNTRPILVKEDAAVQFTSLLEASETAYTATAGTGPYTVAGAFEKGENGAAGKMLWVTSKAVADVDISAAIGGGNMTFFLNGVRWLGADEQTDFVHGKKVTAQRLTFSDGQKQLWQILLIFVIPSLVVIAGVFVCLKRKRQ